MRLYRPVALLLIRRDRRARLRGFRLHVPRGVFHPRLFFSTRFLLDEVARLDLKGRTALEVGCGSGAISLAMAAGGAVVTAVDIDPLAVRTTIDNARMNRLAVTALVSDLFEAIPDSTFQVIAVNPPYYRRDPTTPAEHAWFCGAGMEFFHRFFEQLPIHLESSSIVLMVLSEDCDIDEIGRIADRYGFLLQLRRRNIIWLEENMIYECARTTIS